MSFPTAVNSQITDAITQANLKVVGEVPAIGIGSLVLATSQALANAAHNATSSQVEAGVASRAAMASAVNSILAVESGTSASTVKREVFA